MRGWLDSPRLPAVAAGALAVLLVTVALLQYRWIGEVSQAERQRMREGLEAAAERLAAEVDREVARVLFAFQPLAHGGEEDESSQRDALRRQLRVWRATAPHPELVRDVFLAAPGAGALALERLDPAGERFAPASWPSDLAPVRARLEGERSRAHRQRGLHPWGIDPAVPAAVLPLARSARGDGSRAAPRALIVRLDREFLAAALLPELVDAWFGGPGAADPLVAVTDARGPVYLSDPALPVARYLPGDVAVPLLHLRRLPAGFGGRRRPGHFHALHHAAGASSWQVRVTHRAGSLEAAVARARLHNLGVSAAVLALLAASFALLAVAAQRARRLARQQMELVAGVTHELNTPLAAIRSAGQNLADGVIADPSQVRRYGTLIEREGSRLSSLVAKALELAGIQSGSRVYRPEPVALADVVGEALADSRWVLEEEGFAVEEDLPAGLPPVLADRAALRMAVQNLVDNAVKHAASGRWLGLRARAESGWVTLTVEDRGPGVRPEDRPRLFEPFYRGAAAGAPVPGSGLGLSLVRQAVEAQGGEVSVTPGPGGRGSAFVLRLPIAPAERGAAASLEPRRESP